MRRFIAGVLLGLVIVGCRQPSFGEVEGERATPGVSRVEPAPTGDFVVFREREFVLRTIGSPVLAPVTVGSRPSPTNIVSDDPGIVSIDANGRLIGRRNGTARVRALSTGSVLEVVVASSMQLRLDPAAMRLTPGERARVRVVAADGTEIAPVAVRWSTPIPQIAGASDGLLTAGDRLGETTLSATYAGMSAQMRVEVAAARAFTIAPQSPKVRRGELVAFGAVSRTGRLPVTWSASDARILSHVQDNLFRGVTVGEATVCGSDGRRSTCTKVGVVP